mmetsp:Transcript_33123/g.48366  ORF Transcript_33123/g.48366 Transcript_33123/m.48366 type:complete len:448 (+) Transcript_33123:258-1601(+)
MAKNTPKGLPGFLRRSLRTPYEDSNDTLDNNIHLPVMEPPSPPQQQRQSPPQLTKSQSKEEDSMEMDMPTPNRRFQMPRPFTREPDSPSQHSTSSPPPSPSSTTSSSSQPPQRQTYKETKYQNTITESVVNLRDLRSLSWNGIPPQHRPTAWKILLGYLPANSSRRQHTLDRKRSEYKDAIAQHYDIDDNARTDAEQVTLRQVLVDVPRTAPTIPVFRNERVRRSLARLLYIWAMRHPASSYVQGINDLATPLYLVFLSQYFPNTDVLQDDTCVQNATDALLQKVEADTYWCLTKLLSGIQDHYTSDQPGVQRMVMRLEELIKRIDKDLALHFEQTGIQFIQFAFKWMNCLLLREFNLSSVMRLWDTYLSEGDGGFEDFHVYVCAAFLCQFSGQLKGMEFDELFQFMQNMPTEDWTDTEIEVLLSQAYVLSTLFGGSDAHLQSQTSA